MIVSDRKTDEAPMAKSKRVTVRERLGERITFRLPAEQDGKLRALAVRLNLSPSDLCRIALGVLLRWDRAIAAGVLAKDESAASEM